VPIRWQFYDDLLKALAPFGSGQAVPNKLAALVCYTNVIERGGNRSRRLHKDLFRSLYGVFTSHAGAAHSPDNGKV